MTTITAPTVPRNFTTNGDIHLIDSGNADLGVGSVYLTSVSSELMVNGNSNFHTTQFILDNGDLSIGGAGALTSNTTGAISLTSATSALLTTSVSTATISATHTTSGKVLIQGNGAGADTVRLFANNATSGQVALASSGASTSVPAILLSATGTTGGGISLISASGSSTVKAISLTATDTTNGSVLISGAGNFVATVPAVTITAPNTTSGQILLTSASASTTIDSIVISGTSATGGAVNITSAGPGVSSNSISITATNATSGKINIAAAGTATTAVNVSASAGGINMSAIKDIVITTSDTTNGVKIATGTSAVPITLGTTASTVTIPGSLNVVGTFTQLATVNTTVYDNVITLNAGPGTAGLDAGIAIRRTQAPAATIVGDVVTNPNPVQESGAFQAGSATPGTLKLAAFASPTDDFYNGWWITVTSGTGINQTRRIKSYVGSTRTATLYVTADNTTTPLFADGLDLVAAPAAADTYSLFAESYQTAIYNESGDTFDLVSSSVDPGTTTITPVQRSALKAGATTIMGKKYNNVNWTASASTTVVATLKSNGITVGDKIRISNSTDVLITAGVYTVTAVATNTFTFISPSAVTSTSSSSLTVELLETSVLRVNKIVVEDSGYGSVSIPGLPSTQTISILKTSNTTGAGTALTATGTYGSWIVKVASSVSGGAFAVFSITSSGSGVGSVTTTASSKGSTNERLGISWASGASPIVYQTNAGSGAGSFTYICTVI
jgi:hypothetical protein